MFEYYREKFISYMNEEDTTINGFYFSNIDMYTVIEIVAAAVLTFISVLLKNQVLSYLIYIVTFIILSREMIFRLSAKISKKKVNSRELYLFVACVICFICGKPSVAVFAAWLSRIGDIVLSAITSNILTKCDCPNVNSIGYKALKYRPKSSIEKNIISTYRVMPLVAVALSVFIALFSVLIGKFNWGYLLNFTAVMLILSINIIFPLFLPLIYRVFSYCNKRQGVKIGGFISFTSLKELKSVVLNKSGILIDDEYVIYSVLGTEYSEDEVLEMAAYAEYKSVHPIADAILRRYNSQINEELISDFKEQIGGGVQAEVGGSVIHVGSERYMREKNVVISTKVSNAVNDRLILFVAMDGIEVGCIQLAYKRIKSAKSLVDLFKKNTNVSLLTSADTKLASDICEFFGINDYYAECSDVMSAQVVNMKSAEINENGSIAFVTNDAKRLHLADLCDISVLAGASEFSDEEKSRYDVLIEDNSSESICGFFTDVFYVKKMWRFICVFELLLKAALMFLALIGIIDIFVSVLINLFVSIALLLYISVKCNKTLGKINSEKK